MSEIKSYESISLSPSDVFAFLGIHDKNAQSELKKEVASAIDEICSAARPRLCFERYEIKRDETLDLGFTKTDSRDLAKNLENCDRIVLICATVGLETDRLTVKYSHLSLARAVILQAAGAAAVEAVLDRFENELRAEGLSLAPRFSCGYGDLPLTLQRDIFAALGCERAIGVTLTDSFLMSPTKSVSAIIGIRS